MQPRFLLFVLFFGSIALSTKAQNTFPSTGNVGIGTTSPTRKLHIVDAVDRGGGYFKPLVMYNPNLATGQHVQLALGRANSNYNQGVINFNMAGGVGSVNNTLSLGLYGNPGIMVLQGTGNVGIGTPTPLARLGVRRTDGISKLAKFTNGSTSGDRSVLVELQSGNNALWRIGVGGTGNSLQLDNGQFYIQKDGTGTPLVISQDGDVGIGTLTPDQKLVVEGQIAAHNTAENEYAINAGGDLGILGSGRIGVSGEGNEFGVTGEGPTGVKGYGSNTGAGTGVSGEGLTGVSGLGINAGVHAEGLIGVEAYGQNVGTIATGALIGSVGNGDHGVHGIGTSIGVYGGLDENAPESAYAGYFNGDLYSASIYSGSDRKLKQNVSEFTSSMAIINKLHPKTYEYKHEDDYKLMRLPSGRHFGLIAQEVEEVLPDLIKTTRFDAGKEKYYAGLKTKSNQLQKTAPNSELLEFKAVNYTELIPIVIKGMQEQQEQIENQQQLITAKDKKIEELETRLTKLETLLTAKGANASVSLSAAFLEQASPNPSKGSTLIRYAVPDGTTAARLTLVNSKGQLLKEVSLGTSGAGQASLNTASLPAGTYTYTLWVNGQQTASKQLVVAR